MEIMAPRIAIPLPHSSDSEYAQRAMPQYERAVEMAGGEAIRIPVDQNASHILERIGDCDGVLLPGSPADVDPTKFHAVRSLHTAAPDVSRDMVDELLLRDAYKMRKPVLGICYGLQSLNVFRTGTLVQHIPDFLPEEKRGRVNHEAGKKVAVAHTVEIERDTRLAEIVDPDRDELGSAVREPLLLSVNSSHHQSAETVGVGLRVVARCPDDGIVEAVEGTSPDHFVLAVQWHPERSVGEDGASLAIFKALVKAARR